MTGSSNTKRFSEWFQVRWAEKLGDQACPYLIRWTFILFGRSIRIHHWLRSDDRRYFHDHSADLLSIVLKGKYKNVNPADPDYAPGYMKGESSNIVEHPVEGIFNSWKNFFNMGNSIWFSKATVRHYLDIPKEGAWTLLLEGKQYNKWGFYVPYGCDNRNKVRKFRPLRYFSKFGIAQSKDYQ